MSPPHLQQAAIAPNTQVVKQIWVYIKEHNLQNPAVCLQLRSCAVTVQADQLLRQLCAQQQH